MSSYRAVQLLNPISINTNVNPRGAYDNATAYAQGDSVSYGNSSYLCIQTTVGNNPTNTTYWQLLATASTVRLTTSVYNQTGATIQKGSAVYINGAHGNLPTITKAQANSEAGSSKTYGLVSADIANNASGIVVAIGNIDNLDTSSFSDGDRLWLSPSIAGGVTSTVPTPPNHAVFIGFVVRSHPTLGVIELKIQNGFELEEIHNVLISTPKTGELLSYESGLWKNKEDKSIINALIFG
jgi:hypothetical protein